MALPEQTQTTQQPAQNDTTAPKQKQKLHGRAFYESIGSPRLVVAPMVDRSEFAWRMLTRSFMPDTPSPENKNTILGYTPMFHARLFHQTAGYRSQHFDAPQRDGNDALDRPLIVQFCANEPADLLAAARLVEPFCDAVDLNLGCPQGIAKKGHYGAFLQEEPRLIYELVNTLHTQLRIPVTAKFRIQETLEETLEYAKMLLDAGASILTVHGRRREQKGHNTGLADWAYIRYLRENLPADTVIFANGNVLNHGDVEKCVEATGADAVMSAEGNLSDPTIFAGKPDESVVGETEMKRMYWTGRDGKGGYRIDFVLRRYMDIIHEYVLEETKPARRPLYLPGDAPATTSTFEGPEENEETEETDEPPAKKQKRSKTNKEKYTRPTSPNLTAMQGHLFQLLRPLISHKTLIRDALARTRAGDIEGFERVVEMVEGAVEEGIRDYDDSKEVVKGVDVEGLSGSERTRAEVGRPWWVCQPYVRPLPEEALEKGALAEKKGKGKKKSMKEEGSESGKENVEPAAK